MTVVDQKYEHHWIGISTGRNSIDLALVNAEGTLLDRMKVPNERRSLIRILRHWMKRNDLRAHGSLYCLESKNPWSGMVMHFLLEQNLTIGLVPHYEVNVQAATLDQTYADAAALADHARSYPDRVEHLNQAYLHANTLDRLRGRRQELLSIKTHYNALIAEQSRQTEGHVRREFERMDRRYVQLLDTTIARLDALMKVQMERYHEQGAIAADTRRSVATEPGALGTSGA